MTCRLCKQNRKLCNSHIIPEFFYKPMYDKKGRLYKISTSPNERTLFKQKGIYEKLLCNDCEQYINEFEKHVKSVFYDKMDYQETNEPNEIRIVNIDYSKYKLFQLSMLWRASVAKDVFFKHVKLGPHEEIIRNMLINKNPGKPHDYGCLTIGLYVEQNHAVDLITPPKPGRIDNHRCYRFTLGSCVWVYLVSGHSKSLDRKKYFLTKTGTLLVRFVQANKVPFILEIAKKLLYSGKL